MGRFNLDWLLIELKYDRQKISFSNPQYNYSQTKSSFLFQRKRCNTAIMDDVLDRMMAALERPAPPASECFRNIYRSKASPPRRNSKFNLDALDLHQSATCLPRSQFPISAPWGCFTRERGVGNKDQVQPVNLPFIPDTVVYRASIPSKV